MRKIICLIVIILTIQICNATTINVPSDQPTIQAGIDTAVDGDTVLVASGIYSSSGDTAVYMYKKEIHVISADGADNTIIDCQGGVGLVIANEYESINTVVDGFTIRNGQKGVVLYSAWPHLMNLEVHNHSDIGLSLETFDEKFKGRNNVYVTNCSFDSLPYAIKNDWGGWSSPIFENCTISNCTEAGVKYLIEAQYKDCSFINNEIGISLVEFEYCTIDSCLFDGNNIAITEGNLGFNLSNSILKNGNIAISAGGSYGGYEATNCEFENFTGTVIANVSYANFTDCIFRDNMDRVFYCDGVSIEELATLALNNCEVYDNNEILYFDSFTRLTANNCSFHDNTGGMDIHYSYDNRLNLNYCIYTNNSLPISFPLGYHSSHLLIDNCTISNNHNGGILVRDGPEGSAEITNTIISFNSGAGIEAVLNQGSPGNIIILCSNIFGNTGGNYVGLEDFTGVFGNISSNPMFCGPDSGDFHIALNSDCAPNYNSCGELIGALGVGCDYMAKTYNVFVDGSGDAATIQAAIDSAINGDTVLIWPGTYLGEGNNDLRTNGKGIVVRGKYGPDSTIIDCEGFRAFYMDMYSDEDSNTVLEGLTITNAENGIVFHRATPKMINLRFINNVRGMCNEPDKKGEEDESKTYGTIHVRNCEFINNTMHGMSFCGGWSSFFQIEECLFSGNTNAGACMSWHAGALFKRCDFNGNLYGIDNHEGPPSPVYLDSCFFDSNYTGIQGSAVVSNSTFVNGQHGVKGSSYSGTFYSVINCQFTGHTSNVFGSADSAFISHSVISGNYGEIARGDSYEDDLSFVFENCLMYDNTSGIYTTSSGGGYTFLSLEDCLYINNGGPVRFSSGHVSAGGFYVNNCTFANNNNTAILCSSNQDILCTISNSIMAYNSGSGIAGAEGSEGSFSVICSNSFENINGNYSGIPDQTGINGNISLDPLFCNTFDDDYNIALESHCAPANNDCGVLMGAGEVMDCEPVVQPAAIISIDRSGSMFYTDPLGVSRLDRAKSLAHTEIDRMLASGDSLYQGVYQVAIQYFNGTGIIVSQDFTIDSTLLHNAIDAIPSPKHDTPLAAAMCQAHCLISEDNYLHKYVITYTDGLENESQNFDMCTICDPCNDLMQTGWNYDCDPSNPSTCTDWQMCLAEQFSLTGVNTVHYFGEPLNPFDKVNIDSTLADMYFLKSTAEQSSGGFFYHSDLQTNGYICGDANRDFDVNVSDAVWITYYIFIGGYAPEPYASGDANCDGTVNVSDAVWIINYVFIGGQQPCDTDGDDIPDC
jgi:Right handed beta helix region/Dockerin type I domain